MVGRGGETEEQRKRGEKRLEPEWHRSLHSTHLFFLATTSATNFAFSVLASLHIPNRFFRIKWIFCRELQFYVDSSKMRKLYGYKGKFVEFFQNFTTGGALYQ